MSSNSTSTAAATATATKWTKQFSKTYNQYYWFNNEDGTSVWTEPNELKEQESSVSSSAASAESADHESDGAATGKRRSHEDSTEANGEANGHTDDNRERSLVKRSRTEPASATEQQPPQRVVDVRSPYRPFVAVIVPFRDLHAEQNREAHLRKFVPYMVNFLSQSSLPFRIYIIEQSNDQRKFNRGKLLNIGFTIAKHDGCQVFVFHDVDLLPSRELLKYYTTVPEGKTPVHIGAVWGRYNNNPKYFGGVNAFSTALFEDMNGFPNNFWGWGGEDDELYNRSAKLKYKPLKPREGTFDDLENMTITQKMSTLKENRIWKCMNKTEVLDEHNDTWRINGLNDLDYQVLGCRNMHEYCTRIMVDVKLNNHWTDLVCGVDDTQLEESADFLKVRYQATAAAASAAK
jgi:hypothetical protein